MKEDNDIKVPKNERSLFDSPLNGKTKLTASDILLAHRIKELLEKNIDEKVSSLKELSRLVGVNELKLKTIFRSVFNSSVYKWVSIQRMMKAKELVLDTDTPIKEISMLTGYSMVCNFITTFKKHYGCSPGKLRKARSLS